MYELVYRSRAAGFINTEQVEAIVRKAAFNNSKLGVTGILLFDGHHFTQLLEGREKIVRSLFAEIEQDRRHENVECFFRQTIGERQFPQWSMGYTFHEDLNGDFDVKHLVQKKSSNVADLSYGGLLLALLHDHGMTL